MGTRRKFPHQNGEAKLTRTLPLPRPGTRSGPRRSENPERGRPRTEAVACVLSTVPAQISTDGHERPGSLLLITRRKKISLTTVAHWNISRVPTLALGKGFESGDTPPDKGPDAADGSTVRNVPLPACKFATIVCC